MSYFPSYCFKGTSARFFIKKNEIRNEANKLHFPYNPPLFDLKKEGHIKSYVLRHKAIRQFLMGLGKNRPNAIILLYLGLRLIQWMV